MRAILAAQQDWTVATGRRSWSCDTWDRFGVGTNTPDSWDWAQLETCDQETSVTIVNTSHSVTVIASASSLVSSVSSCPTTTADPVILNPRHLSHLRMGRVRNISYAPSSPSSSSSSLLVSAPPSKPHSILSRLHPKEPQLHSSELSSGSSTCHSLYLVSWEFVFDLYFTVTS